MQSLFLFGYPVKPRSFVVSEGFVSLAGHDIHGSVAPFAAPTVKNDGLVLRWLVIAILFGEVSLVHLEVVGEGGQGQIDRGRNRALDDLVGFSNVNQHDIIARLLRQGLEFLVCHKLMRGVSFRDRLLV